MDREASPYEQTGDQVERWVGLTSPAPSVIVMEHTMNHREVRMLRCHLSRGCLRSWLVTGLVLTVCTGTPRILAAALVTQEEINSVRVYKKMANATVLIASAYVSAHHIAQASGKGSGSGVLIDEQGSIVTNAHVVEGASNITVTLHDGTRLPAGLIRNRSAIGCRAAPCDALEGAACPCPTGAIPTNWKSVRKSWRLDIPLGWAMRFRPGIVSGFGKLLEIKQEVFQRASDSNHDPDQPRQ